ncbi:branched-chain amino acid ABC transporter substrate-binding protein [Paraburkholderia sp. MM5482-R1]|uniref:branched-chain amino acid ABC transporter substrate-binding protein n=1 Tax=unclassified Paraburkholderia TaxID=2615204 RepID=UPI003D1ACF77
MKFRIARILRVVLPALPFVFSSAFARADNLVVKIGFSAPLTGSNAGYGKDMENGVRLALEDAQAQGVKIANQTVTFELEAQDDQGDPRIGVQVAQKLVDDGVSVVIGHFNSGVTIPASTIYDRAGLPMINPAATSPVVTSRGLKYVYSTVSTDAQLSGNAGAYAVKTTGAKRIAVLDDRTAFGQGQADAFVKAVQAAGGNIVAREFTTDKAVDFRTQLTNLKGLNADLVFFGGLDAQASLVAKQMKQLGLRSQLVGGGICDTDFVKLAGGAAEGVMGWQYGSPLGTTTAGRDFAQRFRQRFGVDVLSYAPTSYDATWAAIKAMQAAKSTNPAEWRVRLKATDFEGVTGKIAFAADGSLKDAASTLYVVKNGVWTPTITRTSSN